MAQFHYLVVYDTKSNRWWVDFATTSARFPDGTIWENDKWIPISESNEADIEEEAFNELKSTIASMNENHRD